MNRNEVEIDVEQRGFWKPYRVTITVPAGLAIEGRGWTAKGAYRDAVGMARAIVGQVIGEAGE